MASCSEMPADLAKYLFDEGAALIFLNVPMRTEFGIDLNSWNVGPKFKGIKMIPPGIHFVYYSAVSKDGQTAPRTGFFHSFKKKEVVVKKWDGYLEDISDEAVPEEEVKKISKALRSLDQFLGPYPYDSWKKWVSLTNNISDDVLQRMQPLNMKISSVSQLILDEGAMEEENNGKRRRPNKGIDDLLPKMIHKPGTGIRFTELPQEKYPEGSSAADITHHNIDSSYTLDLMLQKYSSQDELLGDLQMSFICFLVGQVYDAFEHWKSLVELFCSCDDALVKYPDLFSKLIFNLYHQIQEIPRDFFVDIVSQNNFLTVTLHSLFMNLQTNADVDGELVQKGKRFQKYLTKKFKWDFQSEPDDYAPVVVSLSETSTAQSSKI